MTGGAMYGGAGGPFAYAHQKGKRGVGVAMYGKKGRGKVHYMSRQKGVMKVSQRQLQHRAFIKQWFAQHPISSRGKQAQADARARMSAASRAWRLQYGISSASLEQKSAPQILPPSAPVTTHKGSKSWMSHTLPQGTVSVRRALVKREG